MLSPEIRYYDTMRWSEDPLESLDENNSHVSYLSHLAWIICGYREINGNHKHDELLTSLCETMNRKISKSNSMNLPTYLLANIALVGESIMLAMRTHFKHR